MEFFVGVATILVMFVVFVGAYALANRAMWGIARLFFKELPVIPIEHWVRFWIVWIGIILGFAIMSVLLSPQHSVTY